MLCQGGFNGVDCLVTETPAPGAESRSFAVCRTTPNNVRFPGVVVVLNEPGCSGDMQELIGALRSEISRTGSTVSSLAFTDSNDLDLRGRFVIVALEEDSYFLNNITLERFETIKRLARESQGVLWLVPNVP